jgi:hypothetical protein
MYDAVERVITRNYEQIISGACNKTWCVFCSLNVPEETMDRSTDVRRKENWQNVE